VPGIHAQAKLASAKGDLTLRDAGLYRPNSQSAMQDFKDLPGHVPGEEII
jgi:hypothetical protein